MNISRPHIRRLRFEALSDVVPQAIFWRDINYFALRPETSEDELDSYLFASFNIGNEITFDLRHYEGHPSLTCTVYLPLSQSAAEFVDFAIDQVIAGFQVPQSGIAWRRGQDYEFGHLPRLHEDRLREAEARILALKIAAECKAYEASTEYIKHRVGEIFPLTDKDLARSPSRPREQKWQQIVGNVISHKKGATSIFSQGLAERTAKGLRLTEAGLSYLNSVGFTLPST